ncbi:uncharacterized protein LOC128883680 isoform X2 [Hylaeus volcanicus]|uniref:uncharacterized protein LOC128883680 isoform X2 n=1 Tax=Hylaeus volcanicus TaxID=313075 RepID=UPI0023B7AE44|nr:uncharacterized protein LOC128883680 isoform X2 [Hylaeus volcanicus]
MVKVTPEDLLDNDIELLDYISVSSDATMDAQSRKDLENKKRAEIEPEILLNSSFPNIVVLTGIPSVNQDKFEKLENALCKRIVTEMQQKGVLNLMEDKEKSGKHTYPLQLFIPQVMKDGVLVTQNICFVTFKSAFLAKKAVSCLKNTGLDSKHPFCVCLLDEYHSIVDETQDTQLNENIGFSRSDLRDWISDSLAREQYAYRCGSVSKIMWFDTADRCPKNAYTQEEQLGSALCWSPMGSYLVSFHHKGIWLRGSNEFVKKVSFLHSGVKHILFSPNEEYIITWDGTAPEPENEEAVIVWDVLSSKKLRSFMTPQLPMNALKTEGEGLCSFFLFSPDSNYLAMRREKDIAIYETNTMQLLKDASGQMNAERSVLNCAAEQFQWSPTDNILSIWISEVQDSPGRLLLVDIPSRQEISSKNVFSVKNVSMYWHPHGEFLALCTVIARKKGKKTKTETTHIEIFRVKDKSIPVDTMNLEDARVICLRWELSKNVFRFAVLTFNDATSTRSINFYNVPVKGSTQDTEHIATLPVTHCIDRFEWSPAGQYFLAASQASDGTLLFGCLNETNHVEIVQKATHFELTDIFWDPSGRYVTTAVLIHGGVDSYRITSNAGFHIHSFLGRLLYRLQDEKTCQFLWRPRPPSLLSPDKLANVYKKLKEYSKQYNAEDDQRRVARNNAIKQETSGKLVLFMESCESARKWLRSHPCYKDWKEAQAQLDASMDWYEKCITTDDIIDVSREIVKKNTE